MRILYIEDNQANLFLIQRVARIGGHNVVAYTNGEDALRNFESDKPDIILIDLQLAGELNGLDVVRKLRADGHTLPIVAVTAYAMVGDRERCLEAGCDSYMPKPLPVSELVDMIRRYETRITIQKVAQADTTPAPNKPTPPSKNGSQDTNP